MMLASQFHDQWADARGFGWELDSLQQHNWTALVAAVGAEVSRLEVVYRQLLADTGVDLVEGSARLVGPGVVQVGKRQMSTQRIIIATGARPVRPAIPGAEFAITSDDCFTLPQKPQRLLVVSGGSSRWNLPALSSAWAAMWCWPTAATGRHVVLMKTCAGTWPLNWPQRGCRAAGAHGRWQWRGSTKAATIPGCG